MGEEPESLAIKIPLGSMFQSDQWEIEFWHRLYQNSSTGLAANLFCLFSDFHLEKQKLGLKGLCHEIDLAFDDMYG